jgi:hypothetical protein
MKRDPDDIEFLLWALHRWLTRRLNDEPCAMRLETVPKDVRELVAALQAVLNPKEDL